MIRLGLPHYDNNPHCWCRPSVLSFRVSTTTYTAIVHNYNPPMRDDQIHTMFQYLLMADQMFDEND